MRRVLLMLAGVLLAAPAVRGQEPEAGPADSARAEQLRREIERRFAAHVQEQLGLTENQMVQLRGTHERFATRRRDLLQDQIAVRRGLQLQMRPGEAADPDSVRRLNEAFQANRRALFALEMEEQQEMETYLTPVQLVRYRQMREQLLRRVEEMRRERTGRGMRPQAPGQRPRPRPGQRPGQRPDRRPR